MNCPKHPDEWLYENMVETKGYCKVCDKWYKLKNSHWWICGDCLKKGKFYKPDLSKGKLRCPYCKSYKIKTEKLN